MKLYKGSVHHLESPAGKIKPKDKLSGRFSAVKVVLDDVRIKCINRLQGELNKCGAPYGESLKITSFRYIFLTGITNILIRLGRSMISSPGATMEKHAGSGNEVGAPLTGQPVTNIHASSFIKADWSDLVLYTYFGVPMRNVGKIATFVSREMISAFGATVRFVVNPPIKIISSLISAPCIGIWHRVNMWHSYDGEAMSADSVAINAMVRMREVLTRTSATSARGVRAYYSEVVQMTDTANGSFAPVNNDAKVESEPGSISKARLCTWRFPEQDGVNLQIFQVYSGVQSGDVLEVEVEEGNVYWANASNKDGVLSLVFAQTEPQTDNELKVI